MGTYLFCKMFIIGSANIHLLIEIQQNFFFPAQFNFALSFCFALSPQCSGDSATLSVGVPGISSQLPTLGSCLWPQSSLESRCLSAPFPESSNRCSGHWQGPEAKVRVKAPLGPISIYWRPSSLPLSPPPTSGLPSAPGEGCQPYSSGARLHL